MSFQTKFKKIVWSWDFIISLLISLAVLFLIKSDISIDVAKEVFNVFISILAIIFSVFFAALAVLITAGDNEFIQFLEENGTYSEIIWTFKFSLFLLFIALIASLILFITVLPFCSSKTIYIFPKWPFLVFLFLATYALFAAANSTLDAIKYAEFRAQYTSIINPRSENDS